MARNYINEATDTLYRAVITRTYESSGGTYTAVYGPYTAKAPATAAITRAETTAKRSLEEFRSEGYRHTATGRVEVTHVRWERPA